mmetsp:Transcript_18734/g.58682  ORF Transcript_18734/g.58682 Transcript_18734/m.58682 type:complete len:354 (-) Transcript_18734:26-1087(-)
MALADEDVVGLDVRMNDLVLVHVGQADQQLLRVGTHSLHGHALVLRVFLEGCPQVIPHALKHQAEVFPVVERGEQADYVPLVVLVRPIQPLEDLDLLLGGLRHHVVGAHHLDRNEALLRVLLVLGLHDAREDAPAARSLHNQVAAPHDLANLRDVVPLIVVPVVTRGASEADGCGLPHALLELVAGLLTLIEHVTAHVFLSSPALQDELADLLLPGPLGGGRLNGGPPVLCGLSFPALDTLRAPTDSFGAAGTRSAAAVLHGGGAAVCLALATSAGSLRSTGCLGLTGIVGNGTLNTLLLLPLGLHLFPALPSLGKLPVARLVVCGEVALILVTVLRHLLTPALLLRLAPGRR